MGKIAVIGTGVMGRGIAQLIASSGIDVVLMGRTPGSAQRARDDIGYRLQKKEPERAAIVLGHLEAAGWKRGWSFDVGIEAVVEDFAAKVDVLRQLAFVAPVVATNTSSLNVSDLGAAMGAPDRLVGLHFFNPPAAMKLVEVVIGRETGPSTRARALELVARLGRTAIEVKDSPGFVVNRLLFAQLGEACRTLEDGVASALDIDAGGLGHPMGPFALMDLIGLDVCAAIFVSLASASGARFATSPTLARLVADGRLGKKTRAGFYDYP